VFLLTGERIARYTIDSVIGRGATGVVYRARTPEGTRVALKLTDAGLPPPLEEELRQRCRRELQLAPLLDHPALAPATEGGEHDRRPWLTMRLAPGESLARLLARVGRMREPAVRALGATLAGALAHCHERKVFHRDVKPTNVVVPQEELVSGRAWLVDFGLARGPGAAKVTRVGMPLGAFGFAAPEQLGGIDAGAPTDLFGLGVVLYLALTGVRPFAGATADEYEAALAGGPPAAPSAHAPVSPALERLVLACLQRDPRERLHSAVELEHALRGGGAPQRAR
jgi:serine/threonine-protein kinase